MTPKPSRWERLRRLPVDIWFGAALALAGLTAAAGGLLPFGEVRAGEDKSYGVTIAITGWPKRFVGLISMPVVHSPAMLITAAASMIVGVRILIAARRPTVRIRLWRLAGTAAAGATGGMACCTVASVFGAIGTLTDADPSEVPRWSSNATSLSAGTTTLVVAVVLAVIAVALALRDQWLIDLDERTSGPVIHELEPDTVPLRLPVFGSEDEPSELDRRP